MFRTAIGCSKEEAYNRAVKAMKADGYFLYDHHGEQVWKMGTGLATAMHYIKISFPSENEMQVAGWIQVGVGKAGFNDVDLHGKVWGVVPKKSVKKTIAAILGAVSSDPAIRNDPRKYIDAHDEDELEDLPSYEDVMLGNTVNTDAGAVSAPAAAAEAPAEGGNFRFCPECGNKIIIGEGHSNTFIFCNACGHKIEL